MATIPEEDSLEELEEQMEMDNNGNKQPIAELTGN